MPFVNNAPVKGTKKAPGRPPAYYPPGYPWPPKIDIPMSAQFSAEQIAALNQLTPEQLDEIGLPPVITPNLVVTNNQVQVTLIDPGESRINNGLKYDENGYLYVTIATPGAESYYISPFRVAPDGAVYVTLDAPHYYNSGFAFNAAGALCYSNIAGTGYVQGWPVNQWGVCMNGVATVPAAPATPTAEPGDGQATITWTPPANGGSPITGYRVRSTPATSTKTASGSPFVFTGLTNGVPYGFEVAAVNAVGQGPWSSISSSVTPVAPADDYWDVVSLLMKFEGADGANTPGAAFDDSSINAYTTTGPSGNGVISTAIKKWGSSSYFANTSGHVPVNFTGLKWPLDFGTGDFTFEGWARRTNGGTGTIFQGLYQGGAGNAVELTNGNFTLGNGSITLTIGYDAISTSDWFHWAITRSGTTVRAFLNGTLVDTDTFAGPVAFSYPTGGTTSGLYIGNRGNDGTRNFNGHIDEMRFSKGIARYTASFTPPSAPFPTSRAIVTDPEWANVVLLIAGGGAHNSTTFTDASSYNKTLTGVGAQCINSNVVRRWGANAIRCSTATSTTAYLDADLGADGQMAGDFTIEGWWGEGLNGTPWFAYHHATTQRMYLTNGTLWYNNDTASASMSLGGGTNFSPGEWYYMCVSRTGSSMKLWMGAATRMGEAATNTATKTFSGAVDLQNIRFGQYVPNANGHWGGFIQDIRVTKGVGRYPSTCIIPTAPFPTSGP